MEIYSSTIVVILWVIFFTYWLLSAIGTKRNVRTGSWRIGIAVRIAFLILVIVLLHFQTSNRLLRNVALHPFTFSNPIILTLGLLICIAGFAFAIWARVYLGKNWGMPMALKEGPELVTTGPYAYVRNPIYTGYMVAIAGSIIASSFIWIVPLIFAGIYFIYSALVEEKILAKEFPNEYPAYKKRTKMLIPFVF